MPDSICYLLDIVLLIVVQLLEVGLKLQHRELMLLGKVLNFQLIFD
jgi:hypothetical protein